MNWKSHVATWPIISIARDIFEQRKVDIIIYAFVYSFAFLHVLQILFFWKVRVRRKPLGTVCKRRWAVRGRELMQCLLVKIGRGRLVPYTRTSFNDLPLSQITNIFSSHYNQEILWISNTETCRWKTWRKRVQHILNCRLAHAMSWSRTKGLHAPIYHKSRTGRTR